MALRRNRRAAQRHTDEARGGSRVVGVPWGVHAAYVVDRLQAFRVARPSRSTDVPSVFDYGRIFSVENGPNAGDLAGGE